MQAGVISNKDDLSRDTKLNRLFVVHCLEIVIIMIIR